MTTAGVLRFVALFSDPMAPGPPRAGRGKSGGGSRYTSMKFDIGQGRMPGTKRNVLLSYSAALLFTALALALRWLLNPWLGDELPFITLPAAVAAAVWFGGAGP